MFQLSLWKNLQVSKLYIIYGAILWLLEAPTVPQFKAQLTSISYKEWQFAATWSNNMYTINNKKWYNYWSQSKKSHNWYNDKAYPTNTCLMSRTTVKWALTYCYYPYFKCFIVGLERVHPYQKQKKYNFWINMMHTRLWRHQMYIT